MAAAYCYERISLRFLASLFDIQMRYLVYMRYPYCSTVHIQSKMYILRLISATN